MKSESIAHQLILNLENLQRKRKVKHKASH
jgi:hypothetical protein